MKKLLSCKRQVFEAEIGLKWRHSDDQQRHGDARHRGGAGASVRASSRESQQWSVSSIHETILTVCDCAGQILSSIEGLPDEEKGDRQHVRSGSAGSTLPPVPGPAPRVSLRFSSFSCWDFVFNWCCANKLILLSALSSRERVSCGAGFLAASLWPNYPGGSHQMSREQQLRNYTDSSRPAGSMPQPDALHRLRKVRWGNIPRFQNRI